MVTFGAKLVYVRQIWFCYKQLVLGRSSEDSIELENEATNSYWCSSCTGKL